MTEVSKPSTQEQNGTSSGLGTKKASVHVKFSERYNKQVQVYIIVYSKNNLPLSRTWKLSELIKYT